jgi:hypothetical protein
MANDDLSLEVECPICGAQELEKCATLSGNFRSESHVERKWIARDHELKRSIPKPFPTRKPPAR